MPEPLYEIEVNSMEKTKRLKTQPGIKYNLRGRRKYQVNALYDRT